MNAVIRTFVLPLLFAALLLVLVVASAIAVSNPDTRLQTLSPMASSISAMIAVVVAVWTDVRERKRLREEREETKEKTIATRTAVASLYSANITAWLNRKEIEDIVTDLAGIKEKDSLQSDLKVFLVAKRPLLARAEEIDANFWQAEMAHVAASLRLNALKRLSAVPNIWSTQFRREDIDLLHGADPAYFAVMATIWTNLDLKAQQVANSVETLRGLRIEEADFLPIIASAIAEDAVELREHVTEFLRTAKDGASVLANYPETAKSGTLETPSRLLEKSRDTSHRLVTAWRLPNFMRMGSVIAAVKKVGEMVDQSAENAQAMEETAKKVASDLPDKIGEEN